MCEERLSRQIVAFVQELRHRDLFKLPGVAETLDWTRALTTLDALELSPGMINDTLGTLLKYQDDIMKMQGSEAAKILSEVNMRLAGAYFARPRCDGRGGEAGRRQGGRLGHLATPTVERRQAIVQPGITDARSRSGTPLGFVPQRIQALECIGSVRRRPFVVGRRSGFGFPFPRRVGFVRAIREGFTAQAAQLLEAAGQLATLLRLVAAHGIEALEVERGAGNGFLPLKAGLRRAQPVAASSRATSASRRAANSSSSQGASASSTKWCRAARPCFSASRKDLTLS